MSSLSSSCNLDTRRNKPERMNTFISSQVRDEYRMDYDAGRGGYGTILQQELAARQSMMAMYAGEMNLGDLGGFKGGQAAAAGQQQEAENPRFRDESDDER